MPFPNTHKSLQSPVMTCQACLKCFWLVYAEFNNFQGILIIFCCSFYQSYLYLLRAPQEHEFYKDSNSFTSIFMSPQPSLVDGEWMLSWLHKGPGASLLSCYLVLQTKPSSQSQNCANCLKTKSHSIICYFVINVFVKLLRHTAFFTW